jgi:hypothetical protein
VYHRVTPNAINAAATATISPAAAFAVIVSPRLRSPNADTVLTTPGYGRDGRSGACFSASDVAE